MRIRNISAAWIRTALNHAVLDVVGPGEPHHIAAVDDRITYNRISILQMENRLYVIRSSTAAMWWGSPGPTTAHTA